MFLNMLNEKESKLFLELAKIAMDVDGKEDESEMNILNAYKTEIGLLDYQTTGVDYREIITKFKSSTKRIRKVVLIEIAGILDADDVIDKKEENWVIKLGADLEFRDSEIKKMIRWTEDFNDLINEAFEYINNRS